MKFNIILMVIDTLRLDYSLSIYDKLSKFGFVQYRAIAPSPWTFPSHVSLFSGEYPSVHGAHETRTEKGWGIRLKYRPLLTHTLKQYGYTTYLFTANPYVRPSLGFSGFDYFYEVVGWSLSLSLLSHDDVLKIKSIKQRYQLTSKVSLLEYLLANDKRLLSKILLSKLISPVSPIYKKITSRIKNWPLDKGSSELFRKFYEAVDFSKPFFAFFNLLEVHEPYSLDDDGSCVKETLLSGTLKNQCLRSWKRGYKREVEYISGRLKEFFESLEEREILDSTLVILTSDHGQFLGEHSLLGHGFTVFDEVVQVPLFIKYPYQASTTSFNEFTSLVYIKDFIINTIYANLHGDNPYPIGTKHPVFSESFGIGGLSVNPTTDAEKERISFFEKHRIAVYHGPYKGIYNVDDRILECVKSYDGSEITEEVKDMLIKDVKKFLRGARLKTAVRRVNLKGKI